MSNDLSQLSKPALIAEIGALKGKIVDLQNDLLKSNLIAAVRQDVIRLLGFQMNRSPAPDPRTIAPKDPAARKVIAMELEDVARHLREQADTMDRSAKLLRKSDEGKDDDDGSNVENGDPDPKG